MSKTKGHKTLNLKKKLVFRYLFTKEKVVETYKISNMQGLHTNILEQRASFLNFATTTNR